MRHGGEISTATRHGEHANLRREQWIVRRSGTGAAEQQMMALPDVQERGEAPATGQEGGDEQAMERMESGQRPD